MEVIENNNRDRYVEIICPHCNSRLGAYPDDIHYNEIAHHCSTFEVTCGACRRTIGVNEKTIPSNWLRAAAAEYD